MISDYFSQDSGWIQIAFLESGQAHQRVVDESPLL